jgi:copper(I)-binding protein
MLVGPTRAFARGERIPLVLNFEKAGLVEVALAVEAAGARAPATGAVRVNVVVARVS